MEKEEHQKNKHKISMRWSDITILLFSLVSLTVLLLTLGEKGYAHAGHREMAEGFGEGWTAEESGAEFMIEKELPEKIQTGTSLCLHSLNTHFTVSIDGQTEYTFDARPSVLASGGTGSTYHDVPLRTEDAGKKIVIAGERLISGYARIDQIEIGYPNDYYSYIITRNAPSFVLASATIVLGLIAILAAVLLHDKSVRRGVFSIGGLAIAQGYFFAGNCEILQVLTPLSSFIKGLDYIALLILPYPVVTLMDSIEYGPLDKPAIILQDLTVINAIWCTLLNLTGLLSFEQTKPLMILVLGCAVVYSGYKVFNHLRNRDREPRKQRFLYFASFLCLVGGIVSETIRWMIGGVKSGRIIIEALTMMFVLLIMIRYFLDAKDHMIKARDAEYYRKTAYTDALTQLGSRTAFLEDMHELERRSMTIWDMRLEMPISERLRKSCRTHSAAWGSATGPVEMNSSSLRRMRMKK